MTPSRKADTGRPRTAEERERDRLERERRRARERGASSPVADDHPPGFDPAPEVWAEPPADYAQPTADYGQPPADYASPPADYAEPPTDYGQPPAGYVEPLAGPRPPPADYGQPPAGYVEPPAGYVEPPVDYGEPPVDHAEPPVDYGEPADLRPRPPRQPPADPLARARAGLSGALEATRARAAQRLGRDGVDTLRASPRARMTARRPPVRRRTTPATQTIRPGAPTSKRGRIGAVFALMVVVFAVWFLFSLFQPFKGAGHGSVGVDIPSGASSGQIATLLADRGVVSSSFFFKLRAALQGKRSALESGHFDLRKDMSYGAALTALTGHPGQAAQITVTIPEGLSRTEIAPVAKRAGVGGDYVKASVHSHLLKPSAYGARNAHSLEGFLFPSTFNLLPGDPASKLVNAQLTAFKANLAQVSLGRAHAKQLSTYDVLTIASMIEREAQLPKERPLIAAVIYNRLRSGMPLGIDATIRYAINDYTRPLTDSDLQRNSPYNTRLHKGLPPTPIGNPGLASMQAAARPATVPYMYYVVKPGTCGEHAFSSTFAAFQQDVARYNSARAAKGGNSPTTCAH